MGPFFVPGGRFIAGGSERPPGWPYVEKHDPWSSHSKITAWIDELPKGSRILDVGAATGMLGRALEGRGYILDGVEPNPSWSDVARAFYREVLTATLEEAPDDFLRDHDAVVCADVIEHLRDPEAALRRLLALQPPGCLLIVSVPNVANFRVRLNLLAGRFNYQERGILDRTHLHFFTRATFVSLLRDLGLEVRRLEATPVPLNLVNPFFERSAAGRLFHGSLAGATRALPRLLAFQFVALAVKKAVAVQRLKSRELRARPPR